MTKSCHMERFRKGIMSCLFLLMTLSGSIAGGTDRNEFLPRNGGDPGPTRIVTDCMGRKVRIPQQVDTIGCLFAFTGHVVAMQGRADDIVVISKGLRRDVLLNKMFPSFRKARVPKSQGAINIEELVRARPDLLFIPGDVGGHDSETAKLERFGIPYLVVEFHSIKEQQYAVGMIGESIGALAQAREYNQYYNECIARIHTVTRDIPIGERVRVYQSTNEATRTAGPDTLPADWLEVVGVMNVSKDPSLRHAQGKTLTTIEQIMIWDPEVILANETGVVESILNDAKWSSISAVRERRVYQMPIGVSRWGHPGSLEIPLAILWTAKTVYPKRFKALDIREETRSFYKRFFNYELSDEMVSRMLSGRGMRLPRKNKY